MSRPQMDELCANCGLTWGSHCADGRGPLCPGHEDRMDWDQGPGTAFLPSGIHHDVTPGTPAGQTHSGWTRLEKGTVPVAFGTEQK